jgi:ABC-type sugar transport system ATPase subunit
VPALVGVDIELLPGRVHALLGQNGAGKSTLISILSGVITQDQGTLEVQGRAVTFASPREALAAGVVAVYQELSLLPDMTVAENLYLGIEPAHVGVLSRRAMRDGAAAILERLGARNVTPDDIVGELSLASQQLVEIAKAMTRDAKVILLDEPSAVLGDDELEMLYALVERMTANGLAVVYITHRLAEVMRIADDVTIMRDGRCVLTEPRSAIDHDAVIEAMVGRRLQRGALAKWRSADHEGETAEPALLQAVDLALGVGTTPINLSIRPGEILGVAGLTGSGRSRLLRSLAGLQPPISGSVVVNGERVSMRSPRSSIKRGVILVPEDRKRLGLILDQSVAQNAALSVLRRLSAVGWIRPAGVRALAERMMASLQIKATGPDQVVRFLSGGNQQKVVLARCLATNPSLLLLDEPLRGVDVGAKAEIIDLVAQIASGGTAVIVVSSEVDDILALTDHVLVLHDGSVVADLVGEQANETEILSASVGGR